MDASAMSSNDSRHHVVICLGQSLLEGGRVPIALSLRVDHAAAIYRLLMGAGGGASLYVSGADVKGQGKYSAEGDVMRELLIQQGVCAGDIDVDTKAVNTIENAQNAVAPIRARGADSVTLVTSDFHSPRARYIFKTVLAAEAPDLALNVDPAPSGLERGAIRLASQLPSEINDFNLQERIVHETHLMKIRMVKWLLFYGYRSCQGNVDDALANLKLLMDEAALGASRVNDSCTAGKPCPNA